MQADFVLDYDAVPVDHPQRIHLMSRFVSDAVPQARQRRPLNLSLVIDRSGSMAGEKIDYTRQAAQMLVQNLSANDILSIVLYNDRVETFMMPEKVQRKDIISQRIAQIKAGGTTNLSSGWLEGCNLVMQHRDSEYINRVILMSDGLANRGITETARLVNLAQQKLSENISTTTMGLGSDFNEDLLMAMSNAGGGSFYFIESPEVAPLIFREELNGLLNVIGQNLVVSVEPTHPEIAVRQLNAYPQEAAHNSTTFRLGDIYGEEVKALLLELSLPALQGYGSKQIARMRYEYDELIGSSTEHRVFEQPITVNLVAPEGAPRLPDPDVSQSILLLEAARARKQAVTAADQGDYNTAAMVLRSAAQVIGSAPISNSQLDDEQRALIQQAEQVEQGAAQYNPYHRKTMSTQAFYTMTNRHDDTVMLRLREQQRSKDGNPQLPPAEIKVERRQGVTPRYVSWQNKTYSLQGDLIRVGRSKHNEIVIKAEGVSRFHCHIRRVDGKLYIEDLGSTNGTMIGGDLVETPRELNVGDVAYLCDEKLIFHDDDPNPQLEG
jgi:Ca-activated chloride channel family protein